MTLFIFLLLLSMILDLLHRLTPTLNPAVLPIIIPHLTIFLALLFCHQTLILFLINVPIVISPSQIISTDSTNKTITSIPTSNVPSDIVNEFQTNAQVRRSNRESRFPSKLSIFGVNLLKALVTEVIENNELLPKNYKEAPTIPHWHKAMNKEYEALLDNNTWDLIPTTSKMNLIGTKWIFKIKRNSNGFIER